MAKIGLYYPFIHFQDVAWLKLSALYWDRMNRIVPRGYALHDHEDVAAFVDSGFVENEYPDEWAGQTGKLFEKLLDEYLDQLSPRYDVRRAKEWPVLTHRRFATGRNPHLAYVHAQKMPRRLHDRLHEACLAVRDPQRKWLGMHPHLVRAYMLELAKRASRGRGAELVSPEESSFIAVTASDDDLARALLRKINLEQTPPLTQPDAARAIFTLALQTVVPKNLGRVSAKRIIELRKDYAPARAALQTWASELARGLGPDIVKNKTALRQHVRAEYEKTLASELAALKATLRRRSYDVALGAMGLSLSTPALLALVPTLPLTTPLVTAAAGALAIAGLFHKEQQARADLAGSRASYLLKVGELEPASLATRLQRGVRRFTLAT
jgi:hypothetical protein